ncbi:MAG: hypothetical protein JSU69_08020, partial [Candidatus Zixiibacteriota bacterium]
MCRHCGTINFVPDSARETDEEPVYQKPWFVPEPEIPVKKSFLGPRSLGDIISEIFSIYKKDFGAILGISALIQMPYFVLLMLAMVLDQSLAGNVIATYFGLFFTALLVLIVTFVGYPFMEGALFFGVGERYLGGKMDALQCYQISLKRLGSLIGSAVLITLACAALTLTIIGIPIVIYLSIGWQFYVQTVMLEKLRPTKALARSLNLVKGHWWRVLGIMLVPCIIIIAVEFILSLISIYAYFTGLLILYPAMIFARTSIYFDLRVRREGYNPEMLKQEMQELTGEYVLPAPDGR